MPVKLPGSDRTGAKAGFGGFRDLLVRQGKLPPLWRPVRQARAPQRRPAERVNVLWLMADQLRADTFGFAGHPLIETPNLDRLAAEGVTFTNAFCSEPVCSPSRAAMLTGRYNYATGTIQNGYPMRPAELTFPTLLAEAGYRTANIGKNHCGRAPRDIWEYQETVKDVFGATKPSDVPFDPEVFAGCTYLGGRPLDNSDEVLSGRYPGPVKTTKSYIMATQAMKWLYWHDDPRPFFLRVSFDDPHPPVVPPDPYFDMYSPDEVPAELIDAQAESMAGKPATVREWQRCRHMDDVTEREHREHAARYFGLVSHLDAQMGRILDYLDELGLADNTIVIVNSDHGHMIGEHGLTHKGPHCYEGVSRIPTVIRWPGRVKPGTRLDALVEGVDLMPTVLDMLGVPVPDGLHGRSWLPLLDGTASDLRDHAFMHWEDYVFCIRGKRWKLTYYVPDDDGELYDLESDPWEKVNLYGDERRRAVRDELLDRLNAWRADYARPEDLPTG